MKAVIWSWIVVFLFSVSVIPSPVKKSLDFLESEVATLKKREAEKCETERGKKKVGNMTKVRIFLSYAPVRI